MAHRGYSARGSSKGSYSGHSNGYKVAAKPGAIGPTHAAVKAAKGKGSSKGKGGKKC